MRYIASIILALVIGGCSQDIGHLNKNSGFEYHFKNLHQIELFERWTLIIGKEYGENEIEPDVKVFVIKTGTGDR